jgi:hypothetical protein
MKRNTIVAVLFALSFSIPSISFGQYADYALKLSYLSYGGTARFTGMGGAFGAVGGDFSTLSVNPAGIGVYKNSEFSITPLIYNTRSFSEYFNNSQEEFCTRFNVNNVGLIFAAPIAKSSIKTVQFGVGCNRLANFNNSIYFEGYNTRNSFVKALSDDATVAYRNGNYDIRNPKYADELAGAVNLLSREGNEWLADKRENVSQKAWIQQRGGIDELAFTFGGNYADMVYFGTTLGFPIMSYWELYQYDEWDPSETTYFRGMTYDKEYKSEGAGVNGKFGVIVKPVPFLRVGAAVHTPTYYWLIQENEWMSMTSSFKDSTQWNSAMSSPERVFEYSQITPMRAIGSLAFVAGKIAIISADYEWVNHSMNKLRPSRDYIMSAANTDIRSNYKNQHIVRAGAELRLNDFYFRGGYGWYSSPFQYKDVNDMSLNAWSLGAGFRSGAFGLDFAYQHTRMKSKYYPYDADKYNFYNNQSSLSPFANLTDNANSYILTLSYRY